MSSPVLPGFHELPSAFGGTTSLTPPSPPPAPSRRRGGLWAALAALLLLALLAAGAQFWANVRYDEAAAAFSTASADARAAHDDLRRELGSSQDMLDAAASVRAEDTGLLSTAEARDGLAAALEAAESATAAAEEAASAPLPPIPDKPIWAWELFTGAEDLDQQAAAVSQRSERLRSTAEDLGIAAGAVDDALEEVFRTASGAIADFEAGHLSARNADIIELRLAHDDLLARPSPSDSLTAQAFARLNAAASAVVASHDEVLAGKSGPLLQRRLQVEEYARSLAGGVILDFEWERIVNGRGLNGSAGGLAVWNSGHGGHSTITLSDSVAEYWPSPVMRALVAHEVGHAISAKCYAMFDWEDRDANEEWATAWAISQGHTSEGNGVSIYGYPRQEIIDRARTCR